MDTTTRIIDVGDPLYELAWPRAVLTAELDRQLAVAARPTIRNRGWSEQIGRLLRTAFRTSVVADEFAAAALPSINWFEVGPTDAGIAWVRQLRRELQAMPEFPVLRRYYTARQGTSVEALSQAALVRRFIAIVRELANQGLWAEAFGTECPDGVGDPPEPPNDLIRRLLGRDIIGNHGPWPLTEHSVHHWQLDDLYDVVEVLHDLASWPGTWGGHDFGGCIGHPGSYSQLCGQAIFRWKVNEALNESTLQVVIADRGEDRGRVVRTLPTTADAIIDAALAVDSADHASEISHAIALLRTRDRDVPSLRSAIVALAGVLESRRSLLKVELLSKDEAALFDIANNFDLRHRNLRQRTDYDPLFLEWIAEWYLSTITLVGSLEAGVGKRGQDTD